MQSHKYLYTFNTESSINLADDEELMSLMVDAGFNSTFIGIETPDENSLSECNKVENKNRNLLESVIKIHKSGIQVFGGFIVGFDSDTSSVFNKQIDFIQNSGIVSAMVGLLNAPKHTRLYNRLAHENRLTVETSGNNTDYSMNFIPKMNYNDLITGYKKIIKNIYAAKPYYKRVRRLRINYNQVHKQQIKLNPSLLLSFLKTVVIIGIINNGRIEYWKLLLWTHIKRPRSMVDATTFSVYGYHFRKIYGL